MVILHILRFSGYQLDGADWYSGQGIAAGVAWSAQEPIPLSVHPACEGTCVGKALGPGVVKVNCSSTSWPISYDTYTDPNVTWGKQDMYSNGPSGLGSNPVFVIDVASHMRTPPGMSNLSTLASDAEAMALYTGVLDLANGTGSFNDTMCWWVPAIMEYTVQFDNSQHVVLPGDEAPRLVSLANNTLAIPYRGDTGKRLPMTLDGITLFLTSAFNTNVTAIWTERRWAFNEGAINMQATKYGGFDTNTDRDAWHFTDPSAGIIRIVLNILSHMSETISNGHTQHSYIQAYENMLFRAAATTATWPNLTTLIDPGLSPYQSTVATQTVTRDVFHSNYSWWAGAAALEVLVALVVLPMFVSP